jgi:hypothetical protein
VVTRRRKPDREQRAADRPRCEPAEPQRAVVPEDERRNADRADSAAGAGELSRHPTTTSAFAA